MHNPVVNSPANWLLLFGFCSLSISQPLMWITLPFFYFVTLIQTGFYSLKKCNATSPLFWSSKWNLDCFFWNSREKLLPLPLPMLVKDKNGITFNKICFSMIMSLIYKSKTPRQISKMFIDLAYTCSSKMSNLQSSALVSLFFLISK